MPADASLPSRAGLPETVGDELAAQRGNGRGVSYGGADLSLRKAVAGSVTRRPAAAGGFDLEAASRSDSAGGPLELPTAEVDVDTADPPPGGGAAAGATARGLSAEFGGFDARAARRVSDMQAAELASHAATLNTEGLVGLSGSRSRLSSAQVIEGGRPNAPDEPEAGGGGAPRGAGGGRSFGFGGGTDRLVSNGAGAPRIEAPLPRGAATEGLAAAKEAATGPARGGGGAAAAAAAADGSRSAPAAGTASGPDVSGPAAPQSPAPQSPGFAPAQTPALDPTTNEASGSVRSQRSLLTPDNLEMAARLADPSSRSDPAERLASWLEQTGPPYDISPSAGVPAPNTAAGRVAEAPRPPGGASRGIGAWGWLCCRGGGTA